MAGVDFGVSPCLVFNQGSRALVVKGLFLLRILVLVFGRKLIVGSIVTPLLSV